VLMASKFRMALAGLTAVALLGGVVAADPADAAKKKKKRAKAKTSKVVQVSKGGNATAGDGGNGGAGTVSGGVAPGPLVPGPLVPGPLVPGPPVPAWPAEFINCVNAIIPVGGLIPDHNPLTPGPDSIFECGTAAIPGEPGLRLVEDFRVCLGGFLVLYPVEAVQRCLAATVPGPLVPGPLVPGPLVPGPPVPVPGRVFSADGGDATGGAGGNNTFSVTVTRHHRSVNAD
jgi:hypothetical protein